MSSTRDELFTEILELWFRREKEIADTLGASSKLALWSDRPESVNRLYESPDSDALSYAVLALVREQFLLFCDGMMAAFDGATALSDRGACVSIVDQTGTAISEHFQSDFMDFLMEKGLQ